MRISLSPNPRVHSLESIIRLMLERIKGGDIPYKVGHCHTKSALFIKKNPDYPGFLVFVGIRRRPEELSTVTHSFIVSKSGSVVSDTFDDGALSGDYYTGVEQIMKNGVAHPMKHVIPVVAHYRISDFIKMLS